MKKKMTAFILAGSIVLLAGGCGGREITQPEDITDTENQSIPMTEMDEEIEAEDTEYAERGEESEFSFADLKSSEFWFCSGAGAWATILNVEEDGSFSGGYHDTDAGSMGEGYPNGTVYLCNFSGKFSQPEKRNSYTYAVQIEELVYEEEEGTEEITDGMRYIYSYAYGLNDTDEILIYLPGAPLAELSEEFRSWVGYYDLSSTGETELPFYALHNEPCEYGFYSYDIVENLKENMSFWEESAADIEAAIQEGTLTQTEQNEKAAELYRMWDYALNQVWSVLKRTLEPEEMDALTVEEREWIATKEQKVQDAGAEFEGGTMQQMVMDNTAAELTRERVYELYKLIVD